MQNSVIREFVNNPCAEAVVMQQGDPGWEAWEWAVFYWSNHYLRYKNIFDDGGSVARNGFAQPGIDLPFGRHFIIDQQGIVVQPFFGHDPRLAIHTIYDLYGGDCDGDGLCDGYETGRFGHLLEDPDGDPDGDRMTNEEEYEAGTDPADPASRLVIHLYKEAGIPQITFDAVAVREEWCDRDKIRSHAVEETGNPAGGNWSGTPGLDQLTGDGWITAPLPPAAPDTFYRLYARLEQH
jgi:hypothetical protein